MTTNHTFSNIECLLFSRKLCKNRRNEKVLFPLSSIPLFFSPTCQLGLELAIFPKYFLDQKGLSSYENTTTVLLRKRDHFLGLSFLAKYFSSRAQFSVIRCEEKTEERKKKTRNETVPVLLYRPMIDYIFARDTIQT